MTEPHENPYATLGDGALTEDPLWATIAGGKHSAPQVQRERDDQMLPGAGSFALFGLAVVASVVGLAIEFNALPVPSAGYAGWLPRGCVVVALMAGFAGTRLRWRRPVDLAVGLAAAAFFAAGSAVASQSSFGSFDFLGAKIPNGVLGIGAALLVAGLIALERSFSTPRRDPYEALRDSDTPPAA